MQNSIAKVPKVAIIHYWWLVNRGGEAVVSALLECYPDADLYLHVQDESLVKEALGEEYRGKIQTTFIAKLPLVKRHYQKYLPLMPYALESLDLSAYDVVISIESGPTKGVVTRPDALHVCYCLSPMRYIWDMQHDYMSRMKWLTAKLFSYTSHRLRIWDVLSADRVDRFLAISEFVKSRIQKFYRRTSEIIYPPVNCSDFSFDKDRSGFYLCLGQLVGYKRADLAVESFNQTDLPLIIIGEGELFESLKKKAKPNITLLGRQDFLVVREHLETCKALVFPGVEDFGIVPVEAMAAGAPVIAYDRGGARDTVLHGETGLLFKHQTAESLTQSVLKLESGEISFDVAKLRDHALSFDKKLFKKNISQYISNEYEQFLRNV